MRNSDVLQKKFDRVVRTGEVPYQANRRALRLLDIEDEGESGLSEVLTTQKGLANLITELNGLYRLARKLKGQSESQSRSASGGISELPAYYKLKTMGNFKELALHFATIRAAIKELGKTEDVMMRNPTRENLRLGLDDFIYYAGIIEEETLGAIRVSKVIDKKVAKFERELLNAIG